MRAVCWTFLAGISREGISRSWRHADMAWHMVPSPIACGITSSSKLRHQSRPFNSPQNTQDGRMHARGLLGSLPIAPAERSMVAHEADEAANSGILGLRCPGQNDIDVGVLFEDLSVTNTWHCYLRLAFEHERQPEAGRDEREH